ncbi:MAG: hypothetical protein JXL97_16120 [Bacteroidales bacterium]|nr:hypothetical protein [Bacteroidales bacterium]
MKKRELIICFYSLIIMFLLFFPSCTNLNDVEKQIKINQKLLEENDSLKNIIVELNKKINNINYSVICSPLNTDIQYGEEYKALVYLGLHFDSLTPIFKITDSVKNFDLSSANNELIYDEDYKCFMYKYTPTTKGVHEWGGKYEFTKINGERVEYLFFSEYNVK